jgi:hypothetical protein
MRTLPFLAVNLVTASLANATVTDYQPTRDTFMRGGLTDLYGSSTNGRASKAYLDFYLSDFDRAAIVSAIELEVGHSLTFDDMAAIEMVWSLFSNDFQGYQPTALSRPAVFQGVQGWIEGTNSTSGATKGFAFYDPSNPANNLSWKNRAGVDVATFLNLDKVENANFEEWGGVPYTYREWVLDDSVAFAYLTDPLSLGLFLNASDVGNDGNELAKYNNTEVYSRETTNTSRLPFLRVIVIPEPSSTSLCALAALLTGLRRRRDMNRRTAKQ